MVRRYFKRPKIYNRDKYSIEQRAGTITTDSNGAGSIGIVPSSTIQGMRKVKHITISLGGLYGQGANGSLVYYALVYIPAGTAANDITTDGQSMYEPNQFVLASGILTLGTGSNRIYSPLSRNLNSGDSIALVIKSGGAETNYQYLIKYAITLQ